jgi:ubiquinone/menaquinone biosynthesis C-methylase UbiE
VVDHNSFDRVISSLVLHHLSTRRKQKALAEIYRMLHPGGQLHVVDFGPPHSLYTRSIAPLLRYLEKIADNLDGYLTTLFAEAGFTTTCKSAPLTTLFGNVFATQWKSHTHQMLSARCLVIHPL